MDQSKLSSEEQEMLKETRLYLESIGQSTDDLQLSKIVEEQRLKPKPTSGYGYVEPNNFIL
jgi:hypothetical protein